MRVAADVAADRIREDLCRQEIALEPIGLEPAAQKRAGFDWRRVNRPDGLEIPPTAAAEPLWRAVADSGVAGLWFEDASGRTIGCLVDDVHRHVHAVEVHDEESRILESRHTSGCWGAPSSAWSDPAGTSSSLVPIVSRRATCSHEVTRKRLGEAKAGHLRKKFAANSSHQQDRGPLMRVEVW